MKHKSTKSALLMSFTSLLLCFAMLIGTTFAWFTDSVTSGVNKIVAGNLDVEVEYSKDGSNWADLQNSDSLFTGALWEPGHTEVVYLRVKNAGTLALKYDLKVSPVSESGGINQEGNSFKLSDYIKFATVSADTLTTYTRETARTAVGGGVALNSGLLQSGELQPKAASAADLPTKYVTLVVYMPEDVGNVANYKTGTTAPEIDLGITVLATQLKSEADSFGNTYDDGLTNDISVVYNYFPQVNVTGQLKISGTEVQKGDENTETTVERISEAQSKVTLASSEKVEGSTAAKVEAVLEKGTLADQQTGSMTLKVVKDDTANANFQSTNTSAIDTATQDSTTYKVTVETKGVVAVPETEGKAKFKVDLFIGKSRTNVKMYHSGIEMTEAVTGANNTFTYNASTGYVTMFVDSFSPFTAVYDMPVAAIGTTAYYSLESAVAAAQAGETVVLLKDCAGNGIKVPSDKNFTIDFNGFTYNINGKLVGSTGTETQAFQLLKGSTLTFKNGTLTSNKALMMIQNYSNLTLTNMKINGTNLVAGSQKYVVSNNCGTVILNGNTSIYAQSDWFALDSCGAAGSWSGNTYAPGADVTVDTTGVIDGKVESCSKIQIKNGTFKGTVAKSRCLDSVPDNVIVITGGTFSVKPDARFIAEGKEAINNGNGTWTVGKPLPEAKIGDATYATLAEAVAAAQSGDTINLSAKTLNLNTILQSDTKDKELTFVGAGIDETILQYGGRNGSSDGPLNYSFDGAKKIVIKNATFVDIAPVAYSDTTAYTRGFARMGDTEFDNCKFASTIGEFGSGKVVFNNCSFTSAEYYDIVTYTGTDITFNACIFYGNNTKGCIQLFRDMNKDTKYKVTVNDCSFQYNSSSNKTPIYFYDNTGIGGIWEIFITGTNVDMDNNFPVNQESGSWLWGSMKGNDQQTTVTVNGAVVYPTLAN